MAHVNNKIGIRELLSQSLSRDARHIHEMYFENRMYFLDIADTCCYLDAIIAVVRSPLARVDAFPPVG